MAARARSQTRWRSVVRCDVFESLLQSLASCRPPRREVPLGRSCQAGRSDLNAVQTARITPVVGRTVISSAALSTTLLDAVTARASGGTLAVVGAEHAAAAP